MSIVCSTCPLDFHRFPSVILVPLSPLHKGTIVSAPSPLLFEALRMTCLCIVLGRPSMMFTNLSLPLSRYNVAEVIHYTYAVHQGKGKGEEGGEGGERARVRRVRKVGK